jgi:hypothetical protein
LVTAVKYEIYFTRSLYEIVFIYFFCQTLFLSHSTLNHLRFAALLLGTASPIRAITDCESVAVCLSHNGTADE